jgi:hypothetical protein
MMNWDIFLAAMKDEHDQLPDMTPVHIDLGIKAFVSKLCCTVNPIAIIYRKQVCQQCFEALRAGYTHPSWDLGGGSD